MAGLAGAPAPTLRASPARLQANPIDAGTRRDVKRFAVGIAPGAIRHSLRNLDRADVFALRRNDPYAARSGAVDISSAIQFHAIGPAFPFDARSIAKYLPIRNVAVSMNSIAHPNRVRWI